MLKIPQFSSVQSPSRVRLFATPWTEACQASLSIANPGSLLKLVFIESVMSSNHLILCLPLLLLPSIFPSIRVFSNESVLRIRWPKYWSFSFSISPSNEYPGLIFFWMDWLDLFAVQGTLKNLLQHHSSKAPILRCSAFFIVLLSHPYMTTGKTIDLRRFLSQNQIMTIKSKYSQCPVAELCPALWDPMDCSPPGSSVHGILQARILECVAMLAYRSSFWPRDWTCIFRLLHWQVGSLLLSYLGS